MKSSITMILVFFGFMFGSVEAGVPSAGLAGNLIVIDVAAAGNGKYIFVIGVKNGKASIDQVTKIITITGNPIDEPIDDPDEPDDPGVGLTAKIVQWIDQEVTADDKMTTSAMLAEGYRRVIALARNGTLTSAVQLDLALKLIRDGIIKSQGGDWSGLIRAMDAEIKRLRLSGELRSFEEHIEAFTDIQKGFKIAANNQALDPILMRLIIQLIIKIISSIFGIDLGLAENASALLIITEIEKVVCP